MFLIELIVKWAGIICFKFLLGAFLICPTEIAFGYLKNFSSNLHSSLQPKNVSIQKESLNNSKIFFAKREFSHLDVFFNFQMIFNNVTIVNKINIFW